MRKLILLTTFCFLSISLYAQNNAKKDYKLSVNLRNAPFSSLALLDYYNDRNNVIIKGKSTGQFKWEITIPDSIVANSKFMMLIIPDKDTINNAYHQLRFHSDFKNKKTSFVNIGVQDEINYIEAEYTGKTLYENENIAEFLGFTDSVRIGNLISDEFNLTLKEDSSDITVRSKDPFYSWFQSGYNNLSYKDNVQLYVDLAKRYPDSRYLMTNLASNLSRFKTTQDIKHVYENFSNKLADTKWAKRIEHFLADDFQNIQYVNLDSSRIEPLVKDSSKYNLILFSASWCGPCKEQIPLLKELHKNLKDRLNFTYVSMDSEKDTKAFKKILIENDITWRTLYGYKEKDRIKYLFSLSYIPHSLLVYPDGKMEVIDPRDEATQKKLYAIK